MPPIKLPLVADRSLLVELNRAGIYWMMSPAAVLPDSVSVSALSVVTGAADSSSGRAMREPVTTITLSSSWVVAGASCAMALCDAIIMLQPAMLHSRRAVVL